ncbi:MAG: hypothetical protein ACYC3X_24850 [Pirellulaceae bacterium]
MSRGSGLMVVAFTLVALAGMADVMAEEGVFERMSPFRFMRSRATAGPASTHGQLQAAEAELARRQIHAPVAESQQLERRESTRANGGWLGDRPESGQPPTMEELRAHLLSRGIDPDLLDERMTRMREARANGLHLGQADKTLTPDQLRAERQSRGVDPAVIDARLAGLNETRVNNGRFGRQVQGNGNLERAEVQSRLVRKETDPAGLNERLGRMNGGDMTNPATADRSVGAGTGRTRTRR